MHKLVNSCFPPLPLLSSLHRSTLVFVGAEWELVGSTGSFMNTSGALDWNGARSLCPHSFALRHRICPSGFLIMSHRLLNVSAVLSTVEGILGESLRISKETPARPLTQVFARMSAWAVAGMCQ